MLRCAVRRPPQALRGALSRSATASTARFCASPSSSATAGATTTSSSPSAASAAPPPVEGLSAAELDALIAAAEQRRAFLRNVGSCATPSPDAGEVYVRPQGAQWAKLFVRTALPFFAFGVCDNIIMLTVGDLIDEHFGVFMGFSTLVAAGLGQAVSDGSGVTIQCVIERQATRFHFCDPNVDPRYLDTVGAQRLLQIFRTIGIVCGCLCGLTPLLIMDSGNKPRMHDLLLKDLDEDDKRVVSSEARYVNHPKGTYLCTHGKPVDGVDTIVSGEVQIVRRDAAGLEVVVCEQGPGSGIGFLEVVFGHDSVADVVCLSDVRTLRIDKDVIQSRPELHKRFRGHLEEFIRNDPEYTPYLLQRPVGKPPAEMQAPPSANDVSSSSSDSGSSGGQQPAAA